MALAPTSADPSFDLIRRLANPSLWKVRRGVALMDEHVERTKDGKLFRKFDYAKLKEIADNCQRRADAGDPSPIVIGHTNDDGSERAQPEIVGFAPRYYVGRFGPEQKLAVLADLYFLKNRYAEAMSYPRRSVEYWESNQSHPAIFDPISLLRRTPERDLGILTDDSLYAHLQQPPQDGQNLPLYLSPSNSQTPSSPIAYAKKSGRVIYYMRGLMPDPAEIEKTAAAAAAAPPTPPEQPAEPDPNELPPEHAQMAERYHRHFLTHHPMGQHLVKKYGRECGMEDPASEAPAADQPEQYDAGAAAAPAAAPGGANTFVPGMDGKEKEPQRMQRESLQIKYSRLEAESAELRKSNTELVQRFARAEAERQVIQLEAEGFDLDREDEIAEFLKRGTPEEQAKYVDKIRVQYRRMRMPVNQPFSPIDRDSTRGKKKQYSREQIDKAVATLPEGASQEQYEAALAKIDAA